LLALILDNDALVRLSAFVLAVGMVGGWEVLAPRRALSISKLLRWTSNWLISVLNSALLYLIFPILAVGVAIHDAENHWGLLNILGLPTMINILLFIVLFDLAIYWQHRLYHRVPLLWRLHRMHHCDPDFDVSTGIRFHPLSIILSMLIKMLLVVMLGPPPVAVLLAEIILNVTAMFNHGNIYLPPKADAVLRRVLVTPDMHRVHHSIVPQETNSNFGFNFPWWDRLFGTYLSQPGAGHTDMKIGLTGFRSTRAQGLHRLLLQPWSKEISE
jgi:sterol desaturase/sphingolipid hydroxylase (fatty acid hydroxylase superfamily)